MNERKHKMKNASLWLPIVVLTVLTGLPGGAFAAEDSYPVSSVGELVSALHDVTSKGTTKTAAVITLAEGTYNLSELGEAMHSKALLNVESTESRALTIQGDPSVSREKVVVDAGKKGRAWRVSWVSGSVTFKNLTIRNADASGDTTGGGAVYTASYADCNFRNCAFVGNTANGRGGAAYGSGNRYFYDCLFATNSIAGSSGGGSAIYGAKAVAGCIFVKNDAAGDSQTGAVESGSFVTNCVFDSNTISGRWGTGAAIQMTGAGTIVDCVFTNNSVASSKYATIYVNTDKKVEIRKCMFYNASQKNCNGAAVGCATTVSDEDSIIDSYFYGNSTDGNESSGFGGAVAGFSGLISNCVFVANSAYFGGALYNCSNVRKCVFAGNRAIGNTGNHGGGVAYKCVIGDGCVATNNTSAYNYGAFCECEVSGTRCSGNRADVSSSPQDSGEGSFDRCTFVGDGSGDISVLLTKCSLSRSVVRGISGSNFASENMSVTNTLFVANTFDTVFRAGSGCTAVNCSFVENRYDLLVSPLEGGTMTFVNDMFWGQAPKSPAKTRDDVACSTMTGMAFTNCYYYTSLTIPGGGNFNIRTGQAPDDPKLMGADDPERPYAPKRKSFLNGRGLVEDWMVTATDLDGHPRLSDGKVAIGAYETTDFSVPGLMLIFR